MRSIHLIHRGLAYEDYKSAYLASKKVGMDMVEELKTAEKFFY